MKTYSTTPVNTIKKLFLLVGYSASGKDSIANKLNSKYGYNILRSFTTRPMRKNDPMDKQAHIYIKPKEIFKYKKQMVAYTILNGYEYFATSDQVFKNDIYIIDPNGVNFFNERIDSLRLKQTISPVVIYINAPKNIRFARAKNRGDDWQAIQERYKSENKMFKKFLVNSQFDYAVLNISLDSCVSVVNDIMEIENSSYYLQNIPI